MQAGALAGALIVIVFAACSQTRRLAAGDILKLPSDPPIATIAYGGAPQQHAELRMLKGEGLFPVVVLIHGGCWVSYADAGYTAHLATALTREGIATWNLEYRRAHEPGGAWPGTFLDVANGIDALRNAATRYPLDLNRVVVMGHSAGGQLALWSGARRRVPKDSEVYTPNPLPIRGVVSLAGIADMRAYIEGGPKDCVDGELQVMGGLPSQHAARYAAVSPAELLPLGVSQVLVWGDDDRIVPRSLFRAYEDKARAGGDQLEILNIAQANHHELCAADGPGWSRITSAIQRLLH